MTEKEKTARTQRVLDLAREIASMAEDDVGLHWRDIAVAAKTIETTVAPSVLEDGVKLQVRMAPHVPQSDRVELPDGTLVRGVRKVEIIDEHGQQRIAKITIASVVVLGQPEARVQQ
jgi:hypothetical protein